MLLLLKFINVPKIPLFSDNFHLEIEGNLKNLDSKIEKIYWNSWSERFHCQFDIFVQSSSVTKCTIITQIFDIGTDKKGEIIFEVKYCFATQELIVKRMVDGKLAEVKVKIDKTLTNLAIDIKKYIVNTPGLDGLGYKMFEFEDLIFERKPLSTKTKFIVYPQDQLSVSNLVFKP